jgi:hypothetical protein
VTGVADDGDVGQFASQFHGYFPEWGVAVAQVVIHVKTTVYGGYLVNACLSQTLDGSYPQAYIGTHGVLYKHLYACSIESVAYLFNHKGIGSGAGSEPDGVDAIGKA